MAGDNDRLIKTLLAKEEQLLDNSVRKDADLLADILDDGCREVTESGDACNYSRGQAFDALDGVLYIDTDTARLQQLADDCRLVTYLTSKVKGNIRTKTHCASIWKKRAEGWRIVFHQRTSAAG